LERRLVVEPEDNRPYDPLAEAIGWFVRACAEVEFWLNVITARVASTPFPDAVWISSGEKSRVLPELDPDLTQLADRMLEMMEIRNTLAHGIAHQLRDLPIIELQVQPSSRDGSYRKLQLTRAQLIDLTDEARDMASRLQQQSSASAASPTDD
jgi:hypothetical protein